ncbi:hypothetical protein ACFQDG_07415 [Natronoarchaeum mannanilyticum]|uniref:Uncharacterized protein n=1 Tax=Natronoarchaeum mannanilyticum TaxID=926360 RepID=A0AAV3T9C7_9EURY
MTRNDSENDSTGWNESRRGVLRSGALALGGVVGLSSGVAAGQQTNETDSGDGVDPRDGDDDDPDFVIDREYEFAMFQQDFQSIGEFIITSPVIDWSPAVTLADGTALGDSYNTRMIRYRDGELVAMFVDRDAELPDYSERVGYVVDPEQEVDQGEFVQPQVYTMGGAGVEMDGDLLVNPVFRPVEDDYQEALLRTRAFGLQRNGER